MVQSWVEMEEARKAEHYSWLDHRGLGRKPDELWINYIKRRLEYEGYSFDQWEDQGGPEGSCVITNVMYSGDDSPLSLTLDHDRPKGEIPPSILETVRYSTLGELRLQFNASNLEEIVMLFFPGDDSYIGGPTFKFEEEYAELDPECCSDPNSLWAPFSIYKLGVKYLARDVAEDLIAHAKRQIELDFRVPDLMTIDHCEAYAAWLKRNADAFVEQIASLNPDELTPDRLDNCHNTVKPWVKKCQHVLNSFKDSTPESRREQIIQYIKDVHHYLIRVPGRVTHDLGVLLGNANARENRDTAIMFYRDMVIERHERLPHGINFSSPVIVAADVDLEALSEYDSVKLLRKNRPPQWEGHSPEAPFRGENFLHTWFPGRYWGESRNLTRFINVFKEHSDAPAGDSLLEAVWGIRPRLYLEMPLDDGGSDPVRSLNEDLFPILRELYHRGVPLAMTQGMSCGYVHGQRQVSTMKATVSETG